MTNVSINIDNFIDECLGLLKQLLAAFWQPLISPSLSTVANNSACLFPPCYLFSHSINIRASSVGCIWYQVWSCLPITLTTSPSLLRCQCSVLPCSDMLRLLDSQVHRKPKLCQDLMDLDTDDQLFFKCVGGVLTL